jgi:hypothetical protein
MLVAFARPQGDTITLNPRHIVSVTGPSSTDIEVGRITSTVTMVTGEKFVLAIGPTDLARAVNQYR